MPASPTPPIEIAGGAASATNRIATAAVEVPPQVMDQLGDVCAEVVTDVAERAEASRDWWPLAMTWATEGKVPTRAAVVARPDAPAEVAAVLSICNQAKIPVTPLAGRSGVCGGSVPVHGGVGLDLTRLTGIRSFDAESLVIDVEAGTFGDDYEDALRAEHGCTGGHWPQSMALSTVGGWLACRSAGQYSNRYGKIEDLVVGLDVVLADGSTLSTGGAPRSAVGPDLTQLFVGSEGTLGVITGARLRVHRIPGDELRRAFAFDSFSAGNDACRRILQRGATPAVLRLYDETESERNFSITDANVLLVLDEADPALVGATARIVDDECAGAGSLDDALVDGWLGHRNDVAALESFISAGFVVDTMEVACPWSAIDRVYEETVEALASLDATIAASAHQSHAYADGACVYFTFAGHRDAVAEDREGYYRAAWDAGTRASLAAGAVLSHHHGVGLNRARFVEAALGPTALGVLTAVKQALDRNGIMNPGKLGLPDPWSVELAW